MPVLIIGGILGGVFTPTEAASAAVVYALLAGVFIAQKLDFNSIKLALRGAPADTGRLMIILAGASVVSWIFVIENVDDKIVTVFTAMTDNKVILILGINLFLYCWGYGWIQVPF